MRAAVVTELGKNPEYLEFPEPVLEAGEQLVHVRAAGLHNLVKALAKGSHYAGSNELPFVAGVDGVGTLESGERVYFIFARRPWGTIAERAPAVKAMCARVPDGISDVDAAAVVNPGMAAWISLKHRARVVTGETVVVLGATGVAGNLSIQSARLLGAKRIVAVGRSVELIDAGSVDRVICLNDGEEAVRKAFEEEAAAGIDVAIDYIWGRPVEMLLEALTKQFNRMGTHATRLVQIGDMAGKTITLPGSTLRSVDLTIMGSGIGSSPMPRILEAATDLFGLVAEGKLKQKTVAVPLAEVNAAWSRVEKAHRIVLTI
jgi:NADPH2:quinone reductase